MAAQVPDDFVYYAQYTDQDPSLVWQETQDQTQATVWNTPIAAEAWAALSHERLVVMWLEARRFMDLNRLNDPFLTGRGYYLPFPDLENNSNENLEGCKGPACS